MNRTYYYFAASLPTLNFDSEPPLTIEGFLADCRRLLHEDDYRLIAGFFSDAEADPSSRNAIVDQLQRFEHDLRNEFAWARAKAAGKDPVKYLRGERSHDPVILELVTQALKLENLMEAERMVDMYRWQYLNTLEREEVFTFGYIVIYALKLKILARYEVFSSTLGHKIYEQLHDGVEQRLTSVTGVEHNIAETIKKEDQS